MSDSVVSPNSKFKVKYNKWFVFMDDRVQLLAAQY